MRAHRFIVPVLITLTVVAVALWRAILFSPIADSAALYFLDVGQGDSELIALEGGVHVLIDGGPSGKSLLYNLSKVLPSQKKYIDLVVMTHPQTDHFTGFIELLKNYEVGAFIWSGRVGDSAAYQELDRELTLRNVRRIEMREGDSITYGDAVFSALGPSAQDIGSKELNDTTVVLLLKTPQFKALYTGDIGADIESELAQKYNVDVDVLKVGHHGSRFSSSAEFLQEVSPEISVIEVGKNSYGHPTKAALDRLKESGAQVFRTDTDGIIKLVVEDNRLFKK